jgi:hypothetical protein
MLGRLAATPVYGPGLIYLRPASTHPSPGRTMRHRRVIFKCGVISFNPADMMA